jgi:hypothetical protein
VLETAILGYGQWQLDPDSGANQPALLARVLDQVYAAGVQRGIPKYGVLRGAARRHIRR